MGPGPGVQNKAEKGQQSQDKHDEGAPAPSKTDAIFFFFQELGFVIETSISCFGELGQYIAPELWFLIMFLLNRKQAVRREGGREGEKEKMNMEEMHIKKEEKEKRGDRRGK